MLFGNMTERKTSLWTKILLISIAILVLMSVLSNALIIGERFREKSVYLEYAYYLLIAFIIGFGIIYPIFGVFFAPIFSLEKLHTEDGAAKKKWCKKLTQNLLKNVELSEEERAEIMKLQEVDDHTDDELIAFFDRKIILSYTMLSGAIEDLDVEEYVPMVMEGALGKLGKLAIASTTQGLVNALTTLRIASITKNYLLNADINQTKKELRSKSFKEAGAALKDLALQFVEDKVTNPIKNVYSKFGHGSKKTESVQ